MGEGSGGEGGGGGESRLYAQAYNITISSIMPPQFNLCWWALGVNHPADSVTDVREMEVAENSKALKVRK